MKAGGRAQSSTWLPVLGWEAVGDRESGLRGKCRLHRSAGEVPLSAASSSVKPRREHPSPAAMGGGWTEDRHARCTMRTLLMLALLTARCTRAQRGFKTAAKPGYETRLKPRRPAHSVPAGLTGKWASDGALCPIFEHSNWGYKVQARMSHG